MTFLMFAKEVGSSEFKLLIFRGQNASEWNLTCTLSSRRMHAVHRSLIRRFHCLDCGVKLSPCHFPSSQEPLSPFCMIGKVFRVQPQLYLAVIMTNGSRGTFFYFEHLYDRTGLYSCVPGEPLRVYIKPMKHAPDSYMHQHI